VKNLVMEKMYW